MLKYNVVDAGAFFRRDPIAHAEDAGSMPTSGFRPYSNNVKPPGNGKRAAKAQMGVTGGFVIGAQADPTIEWGRKPKRKREDTRMSKNARKRAARSTR